MAKTLFQVQKQIHQLQKEAEQLRKKEIDGVLSRINEAIAVYGLTPADFDFGKSPERAAGAKKTVNGKQSKPKAKTGVAGPKFKDHQGNTWGGRGPRPAWFKSALEAGKTPEDLLA